MFRIICLGLIFVASNIFSAQNGSENPVRLKDLSKYIISVDVQPTPRNTPKKREFAVVFNSESKPSCWIPCLCCYLCDAKTPYNFIYPYKSSGIYKVKVLAEFIEKDLKENEGFDKNKKLKLKKEPFAKFLDDEDILDVTKLKFDSKSGRVVIYGFQVDK